MATVVRHADVVYVDGAGGGAVDRRGRKKQALDIYSPAGIIRCHGPGASASKTPVVIHFHGGSWQRGDKTAQYYGSPRIGAGLAARGVVAVTPSYRLGRIDDIRDDCASAVEWVVQNIAKYGGDPDRIFISGHSAGGHIAASLASNPCWLAPELLDGHVAGLVGISGVYSLRQPTGRPGSQRLWTRAVNAAKNVLFRHVVRSRWSTFLPADPATLFNNSPAARLEQQLIELEHTGEPAAEARWGAGLYHGLGRLLRPVGPTPGGFSAAELADAETAGAAEPFIPVAGLRSRPVLLLNGEKDLGLEYGGAELAGVLTALDVPVAHVVVGSANHGSICHADATLDTIAEFVAAPAAFAAANGCREESGRAAAPPQPFWSH